MDSTDTNSKDDKPHDTKGQRASIWQLALPSMLGNLSYTIVGMVQTKFVGDLGTQAIAAVGAGQRVFFAIQAILMALSAGTTALVARAWGAGDYEEASRVTMASLALATVLAMIMSAAGLIFADDMASAYGLDAKTLALAAEYIRWLCVVNIAFAANFILGAALRASGDAWTPLWTGFGINLVNLPLLYVLVYGKFGFPELGASGAAVAGGFAFGLGGLVLLWLWIKQKFRVRHVKGGWWRKERLKRLVDIGYPAAIEQGVFQIGFFIFLMLIGRYYGTEAFAAYNIGANLLMVCMTVGFGFSIAGSTLVGQAIGAGDHAGAMRTGWRAMWLAILFMGLLGGVIVFFARELAGFFLNDAPKTIEYTVQFTRLLGAMMPLMAIDFAIGGALRGAGDTRFPLMATFAGLIGMRCGLAILATWMGLPVVWVYAALIGDYVLKGVLLVWRFHGGRWKTVMKPY